MSEDIQTVKTGWSAVQVYTLSAICLLVGVSMGYLFRGSTAPQTPAAPAAATMQQGQMPDGTKQPSADDMKRMAEKQVAPLLEQLKSNPNDAETLGKVAHYYMVAGQFEDAATYYDKENQAKPSAKALTDLADAYFYGGQGDAASGKKAIDTLNQALKLDPKYPNALFNLGKLKWEVDGDTQGAIETWQKLLNTDLDQQHRAQVEKMIARAKEHAKVPPGTKTDKPPAM